MGGAVGCASGKKGDGNKTGDLMVKGRERKRFQEQLLPLKIFGEGETLGDLREAGMLNHLRRGRGENATGGGKWDRILSGITREQSILRIVRKK